MRWNRVVRQRTGVKRPDGPNFRRHVKRFREEKRERFLSDAEYRRLSETLKEIGRDGSETPSAIAAIRLPALGDPEIGA